MNEYGGYVPVPTGSESLLENKPSNIRHWSQKKQR